MSSYETAIAGLLKLLTTGAFFADREEHDQLLTRCVEQIATRSMAHSGKTLLINMQQYPTLLALHAVALGAIAADRLEPIAFALGTIEVQNSEHNFPVGVAASSWWVLDPDWVKRSRSDLEHQKTPISERLLGCMQLASQDIILDNKRLENLFDEVEYLLGLCYAYHYGNGHGPVGRASWRRWLTKQYPGEIIDRHIGLFRNLKVFPKREEYDNICKAYDEILRSSFHRL